MAFHAVDGWRHLGWPTAGFAQAISGTLACGLSCRIVAGDHRGAAFVSKSVGSACLWVGRLDSSPGGRQCVNLRSHLPSAHGPNSQSRQRHDNCSYPDPTDGAVRGRRGRGVHLDDVAWRGWPGMEVLRKNVVLAGNHYRSRVRLAGLVAIANALPATRRPTICHVSEPIS